MKEFTVTSPNTCGLVVLPTGVVYVGTVGAITGAPDTASFQEFLTPEDAAAAALAIDPSFDLSRIFGPIDFNVDNLSGGGEYNFGDTVTLTYELSSTQPGTTIDGYQWKDGSGFPIAGAITDTLSLGSANEALAGVYTCEVSLSNTDGRTSTSTTPFSVSVNRVAGTFTLSRTANNISAGSYTASQGFNRTTSSLEFPTVPLNVEYDVSDGFKTVGSPLDSGALDFELFINGSYVKTFVLPPNNGTYTFTF